MNELCRCQHTRGQHGDRENRLEVVPLSMTEADVDDEAPRLPHLVRGAGPCTVANCGCPQFTADDI